MIAKVNSSGFFGVRIYQYLAAVTGTISILSSEMHFGWTSPSLPILTEGHYKFRISGHEASWLAVILLAGTILGAIIAGKLTDVLGRRKVILLTSLPLLVGWIMIGFANSVTVLFLARFIAGISSGLSFSTVPMYLGEIAEPHIRGMLSSLCPVCVVSGILLINILGNYLPIDAAAFVACSLPVLLFASFVWMPESPSFLLRKHRVEEARRSMETLRGKAAAEEELERLRQSLAQEATGGRVGDLFASRANRRAAFVAYGLRSVQQFCGATAITFYCQTIFREDEEILAADTATMLYFCLQLIVAIFATFVVDVVGRKPLLILSITGTVSTLFLMSAYLFLKERTDCDLTDYRYAPLIILFLNVSFLSVGIRNIPLLMMGEVFAPEIKSIALCFGTIYYSVVAMLTAKMFYLTTDAFGMYVPFLIFGILTFFSIFFVIFIVPETKGMSLEDIQIKLGRQSDLQDTKL